MPRANHPIDSVKKYFETANLEACEVAFAMIRGIVRDRKAEELGEETSTAANARRPKKSRQRRGAPKAATTGATAVEQPATHAPAQYGEAQLTGSER